MARPKKEDAREIVYKVRLNEEEDRILSEASEWTGQAKSEVFRKALLDYYKAVKVSKYISDSALEAEGWSFDHISQQRIITCPYEDCLDDFAVDFSEYSTEQESEGAMGCRCEHVFDTDEVECPSCGRAIHVSGVISEYPLGAYEYEQINVEEGEND